MNNQKEVKRPRGCSLKYLLMSFMPNSGEADSLHIYLFQHK